jgi:hypothetical protein
MKLCHLVGFADCFACSVIEASTEHVEVTAAIRKKINDLGIRRLARLVIPMLAFRCANPFSARCRNYVDHGFKALRLVLYIPKSDPFSLRRITSLPEIATRFGRYDLPPASAIVSGTGSVQISVRPPSSFCSDASSHLPSGDQSNVSRNLCVSAVTASSFRLLLSSLAPHGRSSVIVDFQS